MLKSFVGRFGDSLPLLEGQDGMDLLERMDLIMPLAQRPQVGEAANLDR